MYKKIIVPMALDHGVGNKGMDIAKGLRSAGGEIIAFHALEPIPRAVRHYISAQQTQETEDRAKAVLEERIANMENARAVVLSGHAGWAITELAENIGADCIVISSHKPGLQHLLLGSTAARVVRHANCAVHVVR
jgi:nucleotide-binding universal stress UspA family protein